MSRLIRASLFVAAAAVAAAGCDTQEDLFNPPTGPAPVPVTEAFTGTLTPNGATTHPFSVQAGGTITATLTTVDPDAIVGLSLGTWNGLGCSITIAIDRAVKGTVATGTASTVGNLCVRVYDIGEVTAPTAYEVSVFHP